MYALIDCNNFYVACERLFRPDLTAQPVIVLSNNDGCVIARSLEAKALGIAMGVPFFKVKALCAHQRVHVFSSNYTLYGDLSQRVMSTIKAMWPHIEIYSIDEAFLDLTSMPVDKQAEFGQALQQKIYQETGIPTSIGIGASKTLAKMANYLCKTMLYRPVLHLYKEHTTWLPHIPIDKVWGVGARLSAKLMQQGIQTAHDLASFDKMYLKQQYGVVLLRTALELCGTPCSGLTPIQPKQSMVSSKSFGQMQNSYEILAHAVSRHSACVTRKLRQQNSLAGHVWVSIATHRHRLDLAQHVQAVEMRFTQPTDDIRLITQYAKQGLAKLFKAGYLYQKVGVGLGGLVSQDTYQGDIFHQPSAAIEAKKARFMAVFDAVNKRYGQHTLYLAAEGYAKPWARRAQLKSPAYTTCWADLPVAWLK
ncbi:MAG TPA: DNA polymerase V, subunit C [Legionellales bacterium]|nr:DNA polymerase V, subunit C [Legionellales bacterium]|tara:strand:+ start:1470 stop:2732 length:1263 start_codon:yes stop_codon:yes gene_type:complete